MYPICCLLKADYTLNPKPHVLSTDGGLQAYEAASHTGTVASWTQPSKPSWLLCEVHQISGLLLEMDCIRIRLKSKLSKDYEAI